MTDCAPHSIDSVSFFHGSMYTPVSKNGRVVIRDGKEIDRGNVVAQKIPVKGCGHETVRFKEAREKHVKKEIQESSRDAQVGEKVPTREYKDCAAIAA